MRELNKLESALIKAKKDFASGLEKEFPKGSHIKFFIRHGQKKYSTGEVSGYDGSTGYLYVIHDQAAEYSRNRVRNVYFKDAFKMVG